VGYMAWGVIPAEPKIWEMFIKGSGRVDAEWDWDFVKPLSGTVMERSSSQISLYSDSRLFNSVSRTNTPFSPLTDSARTPHFLIANPSPPLPNTIAKSSPSAAKPRSIAVATLIAMPSRAHSVRTSSQSNQSASLSVSIMNSPSVPPPSITSEPAITPLIHSILPSPSPSLTQRATYKLLSEGKAEPLPHVEFGIVELVLLEERHKEQLPGGIAYL